MSLDRCECKGHFKIMTCLLLCRAFQNIQPFMNERTQNRYKVSVNISKFCKFSRNRKTNVESLPFISVEASSVVRVDFVVAVIVSSPEQMNTTQHTVLHKSCAVIFKLHIKNNNNQYLRYL